MRRTNMNHWWSTLNPKERPFIILGSIIASMLICYFFIWAPFSNALESRRESVSYNHQLLHWMQDAEKAISTLRKSKTHKTTITKDAFLSITASSLNTAKLNQYSPQVQQSNQDKVRVSFKSVPFDNVNDWLELLWKNYGISVDQLTISKHKSTGLVSATITLRL